MRLKKSTFKIFFLIPFAAFLFGNERQLSRNETKIKENNKEGYYKSISDIFVYKDNIFLSDFVSSQVLKCGNSRDMEFKGFIGKKGQGPGDIQKPIKLYIDKDLIAIRDQIGVSFFDIEGKYINKFRLYEPASSFLLWNGLFYCISINPKKTNLIDVYDLAGQHKYSFGDKRKFASQSSDFDDSFYELLIYEGDLLTDGNNIFYINKRSGIIYKYSFKGELLSEKNIASFFGDNGDTKADWNQNNLFRNVDLLKFKKGEINPKSIYLHAVMNNKTIYLLNDQHNAIKNKPSFMVDIKAISADDLRMTESFRAPLKSGEWFDAFSVSSIDNKLLFLLSIRFEGDLILYEYYPAEKEN